MNRITSLVGQLWFGLTLPARAMRVILSHPRLIAWSSLPIVITGALWLFVLVRFQEAAQAALLRYFEVWGVPQEGWQSIVATVVIRVLLFLAGALMFSFTATLVASPFNDFLAEATEATIQPPLPSATLGGWRIKARLLVIDGAKALATLAVGLLAFLLSWVPVLNFVAFGLTFVLLAFQYLSYPQTRRGLGLRASLQFVGRFWPAVLGFGAAQMFLFSVPFLSALFLPLAVVGGTVLYGQYADRR